MEQLYKDRSAKRPGGGLKDVPLCEHCGRPVRLSSDDYTREEILCPTCATDAKVSAMDDYESNSTW
ncbi:MAG: hypothetical protein ACYC64_04520 [Armatimonadota bacterium]